jgi:hypothetical protein
MNWRWTLSIVTAMLSGCATAPGPTGDNSARAGAPRGTGGDSVGGSSASTPNNGNGAAPGSSTSAGAVSSSTVGSSAAADGGPVYSDAPAGSLTDSGPPPKASVSQSFTLTADTFTVAPGDEVYKCQTFPNPFGQDVDLIYMDGMMSQGSHHFFLFNLDPTTVQGRIAVGGANETPPTPLNDCLGNGLEFHPFPYLSQQPHWIVSYPRPDMGYPLSAQNALMINVHFLNSGSTPIQAAAKVTLTSAAAGVVTTHIGTIFLNNTVFAVAPTPASSPQPYAKSWTPLPGALPSSYSIFTSWSHMHRTAVDFQASVNGNVFYEEKNWDSPPLFVHSPAMTMNGSDAITWSCSYYNDTNNTLTFGDSAVNNVMCIYMGQYYPVVDPTNPDLVEVLQ